MKYYELVPDQHFANFDEKGQWAHKPLTGFRKLVYRCLAFLLPLANHRSFESNLTEVATWYLEISEDHFSGTIENFPVDEITRELGTNQQGDIIRLGPYKKNYGYLLDLGATTVISDLGKTHEVERQFFESKRQEGQEYYAKTVG